MKNIFYAFVIFSTLFFFGCTSTKSTVHTEASSATREVLTSVSGTTVDEQRLRELDREMKNDPETRSAVETIANSVSGQGIQIKFCPVDGERYSPKFEECPVHHVQLKILDH